MPRRHGLTFPPLRACSTHRAGWAALLIGLLGSVAPAWGADFQGETIVFGGDVAYPPFEWDDRGTPRGFHIELGRAMVELDGARAVHRLADWPDTIRALHSGAVDVVPMFLSEQREETFAFTPAFNYINHQIYARPDAANVTGPSELAGRRMAVEELSFAHQELSRVDPGAALVLTANTFAALEALVSGRADYAILAAPTADFLIRQHDFELRAVGPPFWPRGYAFAVRKDRQELADWLTQSLNDVIASDDYAAIRTRWEEALAANAEPFLSKTLKMAAIPLAVTALGGLAWSFALRRAVGARTKRLLTEIKLRRAAESDADWVKNHDANTQVPQLHHFARQVEAVLSSLDAAEASPKLVVALKLADLDRTIAALGHDAAATATREFAARLRGMEFDVHGQTGRDVFVVFGDKRSIHKKLQSIQSLDDTLAQDANPLPRLFAGAAQWPKQGRTLPELLRRAETALSVAIERRESWCEYRTSMDPDGSTLALIELFRTTGGRGLYPVFQPQVDVRTGALVGAEALVRWDAPGFGEVPPDRFIPLLEDSGLVRHVTSRMLLHAVRVGALLRQRGTPCPVSVNVSTSDLLTDKTRKSIFKALKAHDGMPGDLKLELTETTVAAQPETIRWVITRLRDSGIRTSIDDFGTGYSSLAYLSEFPIQEVKIDRSFVQGMAARPQNRSIVRSTIAMAHELGLSVVAEGVETQADLEMLLQFDCDRAQGYFYSKPLAEPDFLDFVARRLSEAAKRHQRIG